MNFLEKVQNLPESKKKAILWTVIIVLTLFLLGCYFKIAQKVLETPHSERLLEKELKIPSLGEEIQNLWQEIKPEDEKLEEIEETLRGLIEEAEEIKNQK